MAGNGGFDACAAIDGVGHGAGHFGVAAEADGPQGLFAPFIFIHDDVRIGRYTHKFTYDGNGNTVSTTDADGRRTSVTDEEGGVTSYTYDKDGRITAITDALGHVTSFTYDAMERVLTITDARGGVTAYTYTKRGEVATKTDAEGYVISYEYDGNGNCVKMTTVDGDTVSTYDELDRLVKIVTPDKESETFTYDKVGNITSSTDKNGNTTKYVYDGVGQVTETIDALGNSALFTYDYMGNLVKTELHRVDTQDKVDEWETTLYEFDGRGLVTREVNALGNMTTYAYDGNGNLKSKTDADGYTTEYTYNCLDLATSINYNGAKNVQYRYNKTGDLVYMKDWLGESSFEVDLLHQLTAATDHKGKTVEYTYDAVGNQTEIAYPDGTAATYAYDLVHNQTDVTETDGSATTYTYDGMGRVTEMRYPNGWVEYYTYDAMGRILKVNDTHPSEKPAKTQKHTYEYDANGNLTYEYMRGNGTGQAKNETLYTYDALNRVITAHDNYGNSTRTYTYDSLGNLTRETGNGSHNTDYLYNNLNQQTDRSDDGWKTHTVSTYDRRGNLILEQYGKNKKLETSGAYTFDETNRMVEGVNGQAEKSIYAYNGLGALMENTWIIAKNGYGYHDVDADEAASPASAVAMETPEIPAAEETAEEDSAATEDNALTDSLSDTLTLFANNGNNNGKGNGNKDKPSGSDVKKTSTVVKQFVVDFSRPDFKALQEHEVNGLDYRYVNSDKARLSVVVQGIENGSASLLDDKGELHAYYHTDYLGTTDYLTSAVNSKVISWTNYNEWGEITHNAVLKCGARELDLVKEYATHDYDAVLQMYYAKARMYDAYNRRFTAVDPILDGSKYDLRRGVKAPVLLVQYLYVANNPIINLDLDGLEFKAYVLKKENGKYHQAGMATFYDTKFAEKDMFEFKEVAWLINNTNGFSAGARTPNKFQNNFSLSVSGPNNLDDLFESSVDELLKFGYSSFFGREALVAPVTAGSGATLAFKLYKCLNGTYKVYLNISNIAYYMDRVIVVENQTNKAKLESNRVYAIGLDVAGTLPNLERAAFDGGIIWDGTGKFGYLTTVNVGKGSYLELGLSAFIAEFRARSIDNVAGVGLTVGGSVSGPTPYGQIGAGLDYTTSIDGGGVSGVVYSASYSPIATALQAEAHMQLGYTTVKEAGLSAMLRYLIANGSDANGGIYGKF